ncbi:MAG: cysteine protease StiP domain-containing protein [Granulosicoccus sp.]
MRAPRIGTYREEDISFLLSPLSVQELELLYKDPADKERLIQQGKSHYSRMLSRERAPDARYLSIFEQALSRFGQRMGQDIAQLALALSERVKGPITLLSFVRAGVPVGVLLHRALKLLNRQSAHYGISIIRDKGIDLNAMEYVLQHHLPESVVFVDGWTGKGAISNELESAMAANPQLGVEPRMITLADPAGRAWLSASAEDWLIPSGILGSTVSGLISRSVLREGHEQSDDFHATALLDDLKDHDLSQRFVDTIHEHVVATLPLTQSPQSYQADRQRADKVIARTADEFSIKNMNRIKPGIAEATRAVLRRVPDRVIVSSKKDDDLAALVHLAGQAGVPIDERGSDISPYRAITLIAHRGQTTNEKP